MSQQNIAVVNRSRLVTDEECTAMAEALQIQANEHFVEAWELDPVTVVAVGKEEQAPDDHRQIVLLDHDPQEAIGQGFHFRTPDGKPYSKVMVTKVPCETILLANGDAQGAVAGEDGDVVMGFSVSACASHELLEMLANPECTSFRDGPAREERVTRYSLEVSDAVCESAYYLTLSDGVTRVLVANFVYPAWFDAAGEAPYDYLETVEAPFQMNAGGYLQVFDDKGVMHCYRDHDRPPAEWRIANWDHPASRSQQMQRAASG